MAKMTPVELNQDPSDDSESVELLCRNEPSEDEDEEDEIDDDDEDDEDDEEKEDSGYSE